MNKHTISRFKIKKYPHTNYQLVADVFLPKQISVFI